MGVPRKSETKAPLSAQLAHTQKRIAHWNRRATRLRRKDGPARYYRRRLHEVYRHLVAPGQRVLELGCGSGDLLAAVRPSVGVGIDFSTAMVALARERHPELRVIESDVHDVVLDEQFDVIILSDLVNELWDLQAVFTRLARWSTPHTRIHLNCFSRLWSLPLAAVKALGLAEPTLDQSWLTRDDIANLCQLGELERLADWGEVLCPLPAPGLTGFLNRFLVKFWPFNHLGLTNFVTARLKPRSLSTPQPVTVVVPARNEAGNIAALFERVPEMGSGTEIIFVEGHSKDDTYAVIEREMAAHPGRRCRLIRQQGIGKGDAVRAGFAEASGSVLFVLDADLTVMPEDLPRFYDALVSGKADLINGVRLVYPMEDETMRFLNLAANKAFSLAFSWLIGQPIKDTLCGTKVLWKRDYERIAVGRAAFGDFDPFGDFDLLFGGAKLGLKILDLPIRYRRRTYGTTNIQRWRHGWLLCRMLAVAARRLKFR